MGIKTAHNSLTLQELFFGLSASMDAFFLDRKARNRRPATLKFYKTELGYFLKWATEAGLSSLGDITPQHLRQYFIDLGNTRNTAASIHCAYRAIKTWLLWSWKEYQIETRCPIETVQVEEPDESPRPGIPLEDVERLLESAAFGQNEKRDIALFLVFLDTGIRRAEMTRLNIGDLNRDGSIILQPTSTKNKVPRKAYLVTETRRALLIYFRERGELAAEDPLFTTDDGKRFTPDGLYQVLRRRLKDIGKGRYGFHDFRRTFGTETHKAGAGDINTSRLMGHGKGKGDLQMTGRYIFPIDDELRKAHDATSPVRKLRRKKK